MYQTLLATTAALLTACAATSSANSDNPTSSPVHAEMIDVAILDRTTGEPLTVYSHDGERWVAGTPGHRYAVSVRNKWSERALAVVSVDGVNVVSGETGAWAQRGYVLRPYESFDILGWRKSQDRVADFVFTNLEDSYAARTGRPNDVGVIGVAVFREAPTAPAAISLGEARANRGEAPPPAPDAARQGQASSGRADVAPAAPPRPAQYLGTGHGDSETSKVATTHFDRAQDRPDQIITIRYDRRDRLVAMGVILGGGAPRPFPESASAGFVPDPAPR